MIATRRPSVPEPSRGIVTSPCLTRGTRIASKWPHTSSTTTTTTTVAATTRDLAGSPTPNTSRASRSTWDNTDQTKSAQTAPSSTPPLTAAPSRCLRPCPHTIVISSATTAATNASVPITSTAAGHRVPASNNVHHGTPNSNTTIAG